MNFFPSYPITPDRPSRWDARPYDYEPITEEWKYEDESPDFNETAPAANAPKRWEYEVELPRGTHAEALADSQVYEDFYNEHRFATPFYFTDKYGNTWDNVYIERYERTHNAHKSWIIYVKFVLVGHGSEVIAIPPINYALESTGGTIWANRTYLYSRPEQAFDGNRHTNNDWRPYEVDGGSGGWDSGSHVSEEAKLERYYGVERTIRHIRPYTVRDELHYDDDPHMWETFTGAGWGNVNYEIDYWNGTDDEYSAYVASGRNPSLAHWVEFISVTSNDRVAPQHTFPAITTWAVRFRGQGTADHSSTPHARLAELETWNYNPDFAPNSELEALQRSIIENQWPLGLPTNGATAFTADGGPTYTFDLNNDTDLLTFTVLSGLTLKGYVFEPEASPPVGGTVRDAWIIMVIGHETVADGIDRVQYLVDRGFRVILLGMPNFEPNDASWTFTKQDTSTVSITGSTHAQFASVIEADGQPILPLFLDQIFRAANWIREQEPDAVIHLTGHSGGGFITSMAAALDHRNYFTVKNSNAGEEPLEWGTTTVHVEQNADRPYLEHDWPELYPIAARFGKFTKTHNEVDDFFYAQGRYHLFRGLVEDTRATLAAGDYEGEFDIYIDPLQLSHDYSVTSLQKFVDDIIPAEPTFEPLDPTTIAWAAYLATSYTADDEDNVGNWNDSTANNRDATVSGTPRFRTDWFGTGRPAVEMGADSTDYFTVPDMSALTEGSAIGIFRTDWPAADGGSKFGTDGTNSSHWPFGSDGFIYDAFGTTARKNGIIPKSDLSVWGVHYWWSKASDWGLMNDWILAHQTGTNTVGFSATPTLWRNLATQPQVGHIEAFWIFSSKLTDDQRLGIKAWIELNYPRPTIDRGGLL